MSTLFTTNNYRIDFNFYEFLNMKIFRKITWYPQLFFVYWFNGMLGHPRLFYAFILYKIRESRSSDGVMVCKLD